MRAQGLLDALSDAQAPARARVWELAGAPERLTIDLDATLICAHSEKDRAAGTFKGGYGFAPMLAYGDETGEALAGQLRPGNAGANNAADDPGCRAGGRPDPRRAHRNDRDPAAVDSAGASHELIDWCREGQIEFSVGYDLTETVRDAILQIPEDDWVCSLDQDGQQRPNGQVCEITEHLDLTSWPQGTRVIVRRERAHPGAQLSFTDHDGHRFQAILTDQTGPVAALERDHRGRARVEDHIRNDKDTGLRNLPFRAFEHNQVWLQIVRLAHDLIVWTQRLPERRARHGRTQAAALPAAAHRRPPRLSRSHRDAAPTRRLALGRPARRRVQASQRASRAYLTHWPGRRPPRHQNTSGRQPAKRARKPPPGPPKQWQRVRDRLNSPRTTSTTNPLPTPRPETLTPTRLVHDPG